MRLIITDSYEQSAALAAEQILTAIAAKPDALLGLATGTTPIPVYERMAEAVQAGCADFSKISTINLDEYMGVRGDDPNAYLYFMRKYLLDPCGIPLSRVYIPNGAADAESEIARMNAYLDAHPIDVQLLSVGANGHIGFNEPGDVFYDKYHTVTLTERTRRSNSRLFNSLSEVPKRAITMGIGGIMRARTIVFLANGEAKLEAMKAMLEEGDVTPRNQGTILKFHCDCTVYLDRELAERITPAAYIQVRRASSEPGV